jgi:hypothetical protein
VVCSEFSPIGDLRLQNTLEPSSIISSPLATLIAAAIAAAVSLISLFVNVRMQKRVAQYSSTLAEQQQAREALRSLSKRLAEVRAAVAMLVDLAASKPGDELVVDAMHVLAKISVFFNDTATEQLLGFPDEIVSRAKELRRSVTKFFVFIDFDEVRNREHMDKLKEQRDMISELITQMTDEIARYVSAGLTPVGQ